MPIFKVNFFFEFPGDFQTRVAGWSETYYQRTGNHDAAMAAALNMLPSRMNLSSQPVIVRDVRVSDIDVAGDSLVRFDDLPIAPVWQSSNADVPWNAALVRFEDATHRYRRFVYLRGIPDFAYDTKIRVGQEALDYQAWRTRLFNWQTYMATGANNWGILFKAKPATADRKAVLAISNVGNVWTITTTSPHGINPGDLFTLYNIRAAPPLRGVHQAIAPTTTTTLTFMAAYNTGFLYLGKAYVFKATYDAAQITGAQFELITRRATGRPTDVARGRRPVTRR